MDEKINSGKPKRYRVTLCFANGERLAATGYFSGMLAAYRSATAWQQWWRAMTGCWVGVERIRRL